MEKKKEERIKKKRGTRATIADMAILLRENPLNR
jgi:hypothetical protein